MMAKPTTTSAAATTIEENGRTWPFRLPCSLENATSARFTAFSWSSTDMKITNAFFRTSTPIGPMATSTAERTTKYEMGVFTPPRLLAHLRGGDGRDGATATWRRGGARAGG